MDTETQTTDIYTWRPIGVGYSGESPLGPPVYRALRCVTDYAIVDLRIELRGERSTVIHARVAVGRRAPLRDGYRIVRTTRERVWEALPAPRRDWSGILEEGKAVALEWSATLVAPATYGLPLSGEELSEEGDPFRWG